MKTSSTDLLLGSGPSGRGIGRMVLLVSTALATTATLASAQQATPATSREIVAIATADSPSSAPIDIGLVQEMVVVERHSSTIDFKSPGASGMDVPLVATSLAPGAKGTMEIDTKKGYVQLKATTHGLPSAATFGSEYMTYVLWAITPEGRAKNLGEFLVESAEESRAHLEVTSDLQAFGLIVSAEPHFGVSMPSNVVVLENGIPDSGASRVEAVDASYQLIERGSYSFHGASREGLEVPSGPFYIIQARNARRIALDAGAMTRATETFAKGDRQLLEAEQGKGDARMSDARQAAQTFEDARLMSVEAARQAREDGANREAAAATREAAEANREADTANRETDAANKEADAARAATERADAARLEAEKGRAAAELEKSALRARLREQLAVIFDTRDTARGLIMNMSNVLFDFNKSTLRAEAREKLAKLAGIVLANPGLALAIEGHADSVGTDAYNQTLSEHRASSVRDYVVTQGIAGGMVASSGLGESRPIASNDTPAGRQENRRVEIVLSGDLIGASASGG